MIKKRLRLATLLGAATAMTSFPVVALAYAGPGGVVTGIGTLLAVLAAILAAIFGFIWYPIKRLIKGRARGTPDDVGEAERPDEHHHK